MTRIEIAELSADGSGSFRVRVSFGGQDSYGVALTDPADAAVPDAAEIPCTRKPIAVDVAGWSPGRSRP
jgi:hypothetical protein